MTSGAIIDEQAADLLTVEPRRAANALLNGLSFAAEDVPENSGAVERAGDRDVGRAEGRAEERRDVVEQAAVVVLVERAVQRLRAVRRLGLTREPADEHRERHRDGLRGGGFVGAELTAQSGERVALELGVEIIEERAHVVLHR